MGLIFANNWKKKTIYLTSYQSCDWKGRKESLLCMKVAKTHINKIQKVQNKFLRIVLNKTHNMLNIQVIQKLNEISLQHYYNPIDN